MLICTDTSLRGQAESHHTKISLQQQPGYYLLYFRDGDSFKKPGVLHKEETLHSKTDQPSSSSSSSSAVQLEVIPPPPSNSFQLEADLRKIGDLSEQAYQYLKVCAVSNS